MVKILRFSSGLAFCCVPTADFSIVALQKVRKTLGPQSTDYFVKTERHFDPLGSAPAQQLAWLEIVLNQKTNNEIKTPTNGLSLQAHRHRALRLGACETR